MSIIEVRIPSIIDTYTNPNLVPPKKISFPANLGLILTQLTTWDDWRAVQKFEMLLPCHKKNEYKVLIQRFACISVTEFEFGNKPRLDNDIFFLKN